jgi:hypothetical protein
VEPTSQGPLSGLLVADEHGRQIRDWLAGGREAPR